jgi:hypothetical protein
MWSPTKLDFPFYDFSVIYYDFSKILAEINKKDKTDFKTAYNSAREVRWMVLKVEGGVLPDFRVQERNVDFHESWGR